MMNTTVDLQQPTYISNKAYLGLCDHIVDCVVDAVEFARGDPQSRYCLPSHQPEYVPLRKFVVLLVKLSHTSVYLIATALVYIDRLKRTGRLVLDNAAHERLILGALMLASKHLADVPHGMGDMIDLILPFSKREIVQLELDFRNALEDNFEISDVEMLVQLQSIFTAVTSCQYRHPPQMCPYQGYPRPTMAQFYPLHHYAAVDKRKGFRNLWRRLRRTSTSV
ncbi:hypothetical protein EDD16DRAFT_285842 [Pisolithus croceorrhizus]|nr:hypothetical protein F5141DRAFT_324194 [Pisolithus sp. B1]KAI6127433.1 hypothetical protein EDD16DRAFT_285842 [Pisolithus croceorrhizus]